MTITSKYAEQFHVGQRVVFPQGAEAYPHFNIRDRLFGTVTEIDPDTGGDRIMYVLITNNHYDDLNEWDNVIQVFVDDENATAETDAHASTVRPLYRMEFPDFDYALPVIDGLCDESWKNEACPRLAGTMEDGTEISVWCDYADATKREFEGDKRFTVLKGEYGTENQVLLYNGDDLAQVEYWVNACRPLKAIVERKPEPVEESTTSTVEPAAAPAPVAENVYRNSDFTLDVFIQGWCAAKGVQPDGDALSMVFGEAKDEWPLSEVCSLLQGWFDHRPEFDVWWWQGHFESIKADWFAGSCDKTEDEVRAEIAANGACLTYCDVEPIVILPYGTDREQGRIKLICDTWLNQPRDGGDLTDVQAVIADFGDGVPTGTVLN